MNLAFIPYYNSDNYYKYFCNFFFAQIVWSTHNYFQFSFNTDDVWDN